MIYLLSRLKNDCYGCRSCMEICPQKCISMVEDEEGFVYPQINNENCVKCNLCEKACPQEFENFYSNNDIDAYVGVHKDKNIVFNSSSGGAFTAIYESLILDGYTVYGVKFTDSLKVIHDSANTINGCNDFRKSKYIQSDTNGCYEKIASQIKRGEKVLFTGVPCQCAALYSYLAAKKVSDDIIITLSILCHGVPNQKLFDIYKEQYSNIHTSKKIINYKFRNKIPINGIVNSKTGFINFTNGTDKVMSITEDAFLTAYYSYLCFRPSCATCKFARQERISDITLGDAWHIEKIYSEYNPLNGVSLILAATEKGKKLVSQIYDIMQMKQIDA